MRAGRMDRLVTLQTKGAITVDDYGEETTTWTSAQVWAERRELRGEERWAAQQVVGTRACIFRIYYRTDLTVEDRLVDGDDTYDIQAVNEIGRREGLELVCVARNEA